MVRGCKWEPYKARRTIKELKKYLKGEIKPMESPFYWLVYGGVISWWQVCKSHSLL